MQGKTINGFTLQRLLGEGGMAEVWYAESKIGTKAAVKIMSEKLSHDNQMQERFLNEAKVMVMLDHPNIRKVYGFDEIDGRPAIVMEYLEGADLKERMKSGQHFTQEELEKWWGQLVDALNYTHAQGIVHRDIKPSNIFIDQRDNARLLDFGIAKVVDTTTGTMTGFTLGTRIYMSPEQVKDPKRVGPSSDVYSLAVSFVHLLTGKAPYDSTTSSDYDIQESIVRKPVDMSKVPAAWHDFLAPYLAKRPEDRPALRTFGIAATQVSQKVVFEDESAIVNDIPQKQELPRQEPKKAQKNTRKLWPVIIAGIGIIALVVAVLLFFVVFKDKQNTNEEVEQKVGLETSVEYKDFPYDTFFMGTIGSTGSMTIDKNGRGSYTYDNNGTDLTRSIIVKSYDKKTGHLLIEGYNKNGDYVGLFDGYTGNYSYSGTFTNYKGGTVEFRLKATTR